MCVHNFGAAKINSDALAHALKFQNQIENLNVEALEVVKKIMSSRGT